MKNEELTQVLDAVEKLRSEISQLTDRVTALEGGEKPVGTAVPVAAPVEQEITEEIVLVISAAIAAFLGKKPIIRQIRLLSGGVWAQEGRARIQASHALSGRHR